MEQQIKKIQEQIDEIQKRNQRVEADKARETSRTRKIVIAILTYIVVVLFFYFAGLAKPFINSIVPTLGFLLSTMGLGVMKKWWMKKRK